MNPFGIVIGLNVLENIYASLFRIVVIGALNELSFQGAIKGFHNGIVVGIAFSAHALEATITEQKRTKTKSGKIFDQAK